MKKLKTFIVTFVMVFATVIFSGCALKKMPVPSVKEGRFNFFLYIRNKRGGRNLFGCLRT